MAFSKAHLLLRMNGRFGQDVATSVEDWSASLRVDSTGAMLGEQQKVNFLESISAAVQAFHTSGSTGAHSTALLTNLTAAYIAPDGKYLDNGGQTTTTYTYATPSQGQQATGFPYSNARVYTLRTPLARGRGHVGRFYWPCGVPVAIDGGWTVAQVQAAANTAKTLIDAINTAAKAQWSGSLGVVVMSFLGSNQNVVNRVEVGRGPDTQRRRDKSVPEDYRGAAIAGALTTAEAHATRVYGVGTLTP